MFAGSEIGISNQSHEYLDTNYIMMTLQKYISEIEDILKPIFNEVKNAIRQDGDINSVVSLNKYFNSDTISKLTEIMRNCEISSEEMMSRLSRVLWNYENYLFEKNSIPPNKRKLNTYQSGDIDDLFYTSYMEFLESEVFREINREFIDPTDTNNINIISLTKNLRNRIIHSLNIQNPNDNNIVLTLLVFNPKILDLKDKSINITTDDVNIMKYVKKIINEKLNSRSEKDRVDFIQKLSKNNMLLNKIYEEAKDKMIEEIDKNYEYIVYTLYSQLYKLNSFAYIALNRNKSINQYIDILALDKELIKEMDKYIKTNIEKNVKLNSYQPRVKSSDKSLLIPQNRDMRDIIKDKNSILIDIKSYCIRKMIDIQDSNKSNVRKNKSLPKKDIIQKRGLTIVSKKKDRNNNDFNDR